MRRREFITLLGSAAAVWPLAARAQSRPVPLIGFLSSRSFDESASFASAFREGLAEAGFVVGQNVAIEYRWADGHYDRLPVLAAELVQLKVSVLLAAGGTPSALAAKAATSTIPVVFTAASNAVGIGLVSSLNKPGGNVTGTSVFNSSLGAKRIELLKELVPTSAAFAYLINPTNPSSGAEVAEAKTVSGALGISLHLLNASSSDDLKTAYAAMVKLQAKGVIVASDPFFDSRRDEVVALSATHAIPANYAWRENVVVGGLMSYGTSLVGSYRQASSYVGRILKGEKPADLPVVQPTKFELVINLKTARALGLTVPAALLSRADEVIE